MAQRRATVSRAGRATVHILRWRANGSPRTLIVSSTSAPVQDWIIRLQMKTVPGVAGADAIGGYVKQYRVEP